VEVFKHLCCLKLSAKIEVFLWCLMWGRTSTKDNLGKRGWEGSGECMFCAADESIEHLLFSCTVSRFVCNIFFLR
jgi:hypothetical protein